MGDEWKVFEGDANPLHDAYIVDTNSPSDVKPVAEEAKKIEGVSEVQDGGANTERLFKLASFIRVWGLVIAGLLIFIAVFLISNTIRITIIHVVVKFRLCVWLVLKTATSVARSCWKVPLSDCWEQLFHQHWFTLSITECPICQPILGWSKPNL